MTPEQWGEALRRRDQADAMAMRVEEWVPKPEHWQAADANALIDEGLQLAELLEAWVRKAGPFADMMDAWVSSEIGPGTFEGLDGWELADIAANALWPIGPLGALLGSLVQSLECTPAVRSKQVEAAHEKRLLFALDHLG